MFLPATFRVPRFAGLYTGQNERFLVRLYRDGNDVRLAIKTLIGHRQIIVDIFRLKTQIKHLHAVGIDFGKGIPFCTAALQLTTLGRITGIFVIQFEMILNHESPPV
jgi:hypothetical protein